MATVYDVEYREQGQTTPVVVRGITDLFLALSGLTSGATYEWRVRSGADDGVQKTWGAYSSWQTLTLASADNTKPVITLVGDVSVTLTEAEAETWTDPGATATDNNDGDITANIVVTGSVGTTEGVYPLYYDVTDAAGNAADTVTRTVTVESQDTVAPVITLLGESLESVVEGETWTDPGATATDDTDGDITADIVVTGSVDTSVAGSYTVTYSVTDAAGNTASTNRTVNVQPIVQPTSYEVEYRIVDGVSTALTTENTYLDLQGLDVAEAYQFRVRGWYDGKSSDWTAWFDFHTALSISIASSVTAEQLKILSIFVNGLTTENRIPVITGSCSVSNVEIVLTVFGREYRTVVINNSWQIQLGDLEAISSRDELLDGRLLLSGLAQESGADGIIISE